jgi:hypothetical protein
MYLSYPLGRMDGPSADSRPVPRSADAWQDATIGWREPFGWLWRELALRRAAARAEHDEATALRRASEAIEGATRWLELLSTPAREATRGDFERSLSEGASVLEACAQVAQEWGPPPRGGRLKMLRGLEQRLQETNAAAKQADQAGVAGAAVVGALRDRATLALYDLAAGADSAARADLRDAVEALEDAAVALAALCVRAALNRRRPGRWTASARPLVPDPYPTDGR